jgi:DNA-binding Lrp family transcriptional regulator
MDCICGPAGLELTAMVYRERGETGTFALLERLSVLPSVVSVTAQPCLHMFFGGPASLLTKSDSSPLDNRRASVGSRDRRIASHDSTDADRRLLTTLAVDGRASLKQLSQASGLAQETVNQRLQLLEASGTLYFDIDFDPELLGLHNSVSLWASVTPACVEEAGRVLATHAEISFAAATTGTTNIYAVAHCVDGDAMYRYLSGPLAQLPGLQTVETAPHIRGLKKAQRDPAD